MGWIHEASSMQPRHRTWIVGALITLATVSHAGITSTVLPLRGYSDILVDDRHRHVFVTQNALTVNVFDLDGTPAGAIYGQTDAGAMALFHTSLYVAQRTGDAIVEIDTRTLREVRTIRLGLDGACIEGLAVASHRLWFGTSCVPLCPCRDTASVVLGSLDLESRAITTFAKDMFSRPVLTADRHVRDTLFVGESGLASGSIARFALNRSGVATLVAQVPVPGDGGDVKDLVVSGDRRHLLVASGHPYDVNSLSVGDLSADMAYPTGPYPIAVAVTRGRYLAAGRGSFDADLLVFRSGNTTPSAVFDVPDYLFPAAVAFDRTARHLYAVSGAFTTDRAVLNVVDAPLIPTTTSTSTTTTTSTSPTSTTIPACTFLLKWGLPAGTDPGELSEPHGVATDLDGNVYVTTSTRVRKFDATGRFLTRWGSYGPGPGQFLDAAGIAVDASGNVYVADDFAARIQKFDASGNFVTAWGSGGWDVGQLSNPTGLLVDGGYVYVADSGNSRIQKFDTDGRLVAMWPVESGAHWLAADASGLYVVNGGGVWKFDRNGSYLTSWPSQGIAGSIAADENGHVYVMDSDHYRVQVFDQDGAFLSAWGSYGGGDGQFGDDPRGMVSDAVGHVYVADTYNHRLQKFDTSGTFLAKWGGIATGEFSGPAGVATDEVGNVYVTDFYDDRVQKFDANGNFLTMWGRNGSGNGELFRPYGIATDGRGNVYVTDTRNWRVQKFDRDGTFLTTWGHYGIFSTPAGVAADGGGNVYVTDLDWSIVQKFDASGAFLAPWGTYGSGSGLLAPGGIATAADGTVYVADTYNNRVQRFDASGMILGGWGSTGLGPGQFYQPYGIAIDASGLVYVSSSADGRIQKFDAGGAFLGVWGSRGTNDGQFMDPRGVATDGNGNVYVADHGNNRIQKFACP